SPDIVIFATDGNPTTRNDDVANDPGQTADPEDLDAGITAANSIKAAGGKIIAVGIGGSVITANLLSISGPNLNDDYFVADFDTLAASLRQIALRLCAPSVTVKKLVDGTPASGWAFTAVTDPAGVPVVVNPSGGVTNDSGVVNFKWDSLDPISVTLTETPQAGFKLDSVSCSTQTGTPIPTTPVDNGVTFTLTLENIATCDFNNVSNDGAIAVVKTSDVTEAEIGDTVTYTYAVTNTGTTVLEDITVVDDLLGPVTLDATTLAPGESTTGTLTYTVLASDLPGPIVNVALGTGINPDFPDDPITDDDTVSVDVVAVPGLLVEKVASAGIVEVGDVITYTYTVTNTGDTQISNITVEDDLLGPITLAETTLAPGASTTGTIDYTVVAADLPGPIVNVAVASGTDPDGAEVSSTATESVDIASVTLEKVANVQEASIGDVITYTYTITNTGSMTLVDLVLTDDILGPITLAETTLAVGASTTGTASHVVTEADGTGPVFNVAVVTTATDQPDPVTQLPVTPSATDTASVALIIVLPTTLGTTTTEVLPKTGLDTDDAAVWGIVLLALGLALVTLGRDRVAVALSSTRQWAGMMIPKTERARDRVTKTVTSWVRRRR
ncbi:MAG: DUF11 domain-containing protein, partial [Acidimicrobiia bacterium]|nr:DUF11 domain-containing protein [Acidimicrobiia bacterium]